MYTNVGEFRFIRTTSRLSDSSPLVAITLQFENVFPFVIYCQRMGYAHNESTTRSRGLEGVACATVNILQSAENDSFLLYFVSQADLIAYPFLVSECPFHH